MSPAGGLRIAPFRFDVTPPIGHSMGGGGMKEVVAIDDPLEAIGYVLLGAGAPVVVCVVDWLGICNEAHIAWRTALAGAAGTSPDRAAVHTVHQHTAPLACLEAARRMAKQPDLKPMFDHDFFRSCLERGAAAVRAAVAKSRPLTHVAHGEARVDKVASNRRVARDAQGNVIAMRRTMCSEPELIALPEGLIDPMLKTVAFYDGDAKVVSCHYYACHPQCFYGDGRVTTDYCGLARRKRQQEEPGCTHVYFNGCGANIGAGKYNDGTARKILTQRMYEGIVASEADLRPRPVTGAEWLTREILPEPNPVLVEASLERVLATGVDESAGGQYDYGNVNRRVTSALKLAWIDRHRRRIPIVLGALRLDGISILHLPAEVFVEYQLRAQGMRPDRFVAVAAYGDDALFYIPTREEYGFGGYEVGAAYCSDGIDALLTGGMRELLS